MCDADDKKNDDEPHRNRHDRRDQRPHWPLLRAYRRARATLSFAKIPLLASSSLFKLDLKLQLQWRASTLFWSLF